MKSNFPKIIFCFILLAAIGGGWSWYHAKTPPHSPASGAKGFGGPVSVGVATVASRDIPVTLASVGTLFSSESADIRAEIAGAVKVINFSEGQPVKKGDSLVEIDDSLIRADLMKAEANYNVRKMTFARSDKLKNAGFISKQDWEQNSGNLQEALADIESTRVRLEKAKVIAPFDGIAGLRSFSVGDYVQVGESLTTLDAIDPIKIVFTVPEKNYAEIKTMQKVSFAVDAWPGEIFTSEVYAISPRINQNTRSFEVKATVPNADGRLKPGMFAEIKIITSVRTGALLIPEQALIPKGEEIYVFVVRDGKAVSQKVSIGLRQTGDVEILSGIAAGEAVVVAGMMRLQDGAAVTVLTP